MCRELVHQRRQRVRALAAMPVEFVFLACAAITNAANIFRQAHVLAARFVMLLAQCRFASSLLAALSTLAVRVPMRTKFVLAVFVFFPHAA